LFRARMALRENLQPEAQANTKPEAKRSAVVAIRRESSISAAESEA
jgi:hypothetical protein